MVLQLLPITDHELDVLDRLTGSSRWVIGERAFMVLLMYQGESPIEIAGFLGRCTKTVRKWINLFNLHRLDGLRHVIRRRRRYHARPKPLPPPRFDRPYTTSLQVRTVISSWVQMNVNEVASLPVPS